MYSRYRSAVRAASAHFLITVAVAVLAAILVFFIWYPWPFYEIVSGRELFWLVIGVDVVCGPLLTMVLWNPAKSKKELTLDMAIVGAIQITALAYGMSTVTDTRPVRLVFEVDRIRMVSASEIDASKLSEALPEFQRLPWSGPVLVGVRPPKDNQELLKSIDMSLAGLEPSLRPGWWQPYTQSAPEVVKAARPIHLLRDARPDNNPLIDAAVRSSGLQEKDLLWLPLTGSRSFDWVVLLSRDTALPLAYAPVDGFL